MKKSKILIVDDNANTRILCSDVLSEGGYLSEAVKDGEDALEVLNHSEFDLVLLDLKLPGIDGLGVLEKMRKENPRLPVVMISGEGDIESAVKALKHGAYDFLEKPLDGELLLVTVANALQNAGLRGKLERLKEERVERHRLVGDSQVISRLRKRIFQAATNNAHVLITGETGSGKDIVARAVHNESDRSLEPFVKLNCAAIPRDLVESELFGFSKGAFTGAHKDKKGRIEEADNGTIFFDEIGELDIASQAKLLHFLENQVVERLGETKPRHVDVRIIAATNKELAKEVLEKRFREDLYYRLNVIDIRVPPLREHAEDIPELAAYFVEICSKNLGVPGKELDQEALSKLVEYHWPGNVRQLRNVIEKAVSMSDSLVIRVEDLTALRRSDHVVPESRDTTLVKARRDFEYKFILKVFDEENGNVAAAAKRLGIDRTNLYRKIKKMKSKGP